MKKIIAILLSVMVYQQVYCQDQAYLRITVSKDVKIEDVLSLTVWNHFIHLGSRFESDVYPVFLTESNPFEITIPHPSFDMRMRLVNSKVGLLLPFVLVEPGDSVLMHIHKIEGKELTITYSGRGSAKYVFLEGFKSQKKQADKLWYYVRAGESPIAINAKIEGLLQKWLLFLDEYAGALSAQSYSILKNDIVGHIKRLQLMLIAVGYGESEGIKKAEFESVLKHLITNDNGGTINDSYAFSTEYVQYLYTKEKISLLYNYYPAFKEVGLTLDSPYAFSVLYDALENNYKGKMRDQLIAYSLLNSSDFTWFFRGTDPSELKKCIDDALLVVQQLPVMRLMNKERSILSAGQEAYDFSLPNQNGDHIRLSDFNGKIVLIDFWGIGCTGCLSFKKRFMEYIYPYVKDIPDFVFVSINTDRRRDSWINALPIYSNPDFVNVSLYDLGNKHPVFQHYNIKALPFTLLIDRKGRVISSRLSADMDKLLTLIKRHLE